MKEIRIDQEALNWQNSFCLDLSPLR